MNLIVWLVIVAGIAAYGCYLLGRTVGMLGED
jgi:hypothetical protein